MSATSDLINQPILFSYTHEDEVKIIEALVVLKEYGLPVRVVTEAYQARIEEQRRQPTEDDRRWPWVEPVSIGEHINLGDDRPMLDCGCQVGRMYALTPGQRDYIRDHFNMTPARLVEVHEVALFPGTRFIRRVTLASAEHVDPNRKHVMKRFAIDTWGHFMSEAKASDQRRAEAKESVDVVGDVTPTKKPAKASRSIIDMNQLMNEYGV